MTNTIQRPTVKVISDYDGYFEGLVNRWIDRKIESGEAFNYDQIEITAGPWRNDAVTALKTPHGALHLDFYSAIRSGFGSLSEDEISAIVRML